LIAAKSVAASNAEKNLAGLTCARQFDGFIGLIAPTDLIIALMVPVAPVNLTAADLGDLGSSP